MPMLSTGTLAHWVPGMVPPHPVTLFLEEDQALQGQAAGLLGMMPGCEVSPANRSSQDQQVWVSILAFQILSSRRGF